MTVRVSGTEGYAAEGEAFIQRSESITFTDVHEPVLHLLSGAPGHVLDIGAGTGRDAAAFAAMGHRVLAVEPVEELRHAARALHSAPAIEWLDDHLPDLAQVRRRGEIFDLVMLTAVWMHLDAGQRRQAMPVVASLVRPGGTMIMSLRHGPVPPGRRMDDVSGAETVALAEPCGLRCMLDIATPSVLPGNRLAGVTWTRLAFVRQ